jgi:broad specificity phosphatase PhoE
MDIPKFPSPKVSSWCTIPIVRVLTFISTDGSFVVLGVGASTLSKHLFEFCFVAICFIVLVVVALSVVVALETVDYGGELTLTEKCKPKHFIPKVVPEIRGESFMIRSSSSASTSSSTFQGASGAVLRLLILSYVVVPCCCFTAALITTSNRVLCGCCKTTPMSPDPLLPPVTAASGISATTDTSDIDEFPISTADGGTDSDHYHHHNNSGSSRSTVTTNTTKITKQLLCIRHGISVANEYMDQPGNQWGDATFRDDPNLIDAPLSCRGKQHTIEYLQQQLTTSSPQPNCISPASKLLQEIELIVVSPLTRCLETYQYGIEPILTQTKTRTTGNGDIGSNSSSGRSLLPPVLAHPLIRERVYTSSDTGRPISVLQQEFPHFNFEECRSHTNDRWWYTGDSDTDSSPPPQHYEEWRPHGQGQWYAVPGEPLHVLERRLDEFDMWLSQRPEQNIMIVAHWGVLKHLSSEETEWTNAEAKVLQWAYCTYTNTRHVLQQHSLKLGMVTT